MSALLIQQIRAAGGALSITADGKISARGLPDHLRVELQQNRDAVAEELWQEHWRKFRLWPANGTYDGSPLYWKVDALYRAAKAFHDHFDAAVEAKELTRILTEFDGDCHKGHVAAIDSFQTHRVRAMELADAISDAVSPGELSGDRLRSVCLELFEVVA